MKDAINALEDEAERLARAAAEKRDERFYPEFCTIQMIDVYKLEKLAKHYKAAADFLRSKA
jgi:hypothetical protein